MGVAVAAEQNAFDLEGPALRVAVEHAGMSLPLGAVPNLAKGDRLRVAVDLPKQQGARYRMVLAFLRGATNPPPKEWLFEAETWKPRRSAIDAIVPKDAQGAIVLLVPDTGGANDAVASAVRGRPGAFVRAAQELNRAMLDHARLQAFYDDVRGMDVQRIADVSPRLADSLAIKLDPACLQPEPTDACMARGSSAAVVADAQTSSIAQTLAGAPAEIALQLSSTPQAGYGYYSSYIGVIRDVARLFGAFQSAQLQFIPALNVQHGATTRLLLNAVPSFRKPQSVLVAALPFVDGASPPPLTAKGDRALCLGQPGLVLPVTGAPLVFATDYPREMSVRFDLGRGRTVEASVRPDAAQGGYVLDAVPPGIGATDPPVRGILHGRWGFQAFDGPAYRFVAATAEAWRAPPDGSVVTGRETPVVLKGGAAACVSGVWLQREGARVPVAHAIDGDDRLTLSVPLEGIDPGDVTLFVQSYGIAAPQRLSIRTVAETGDVRGFELHVGERTGVLTGSRLDQVASLSIGDLEFRPVGLERVGDRDRLRMVTDQAAVGALQAGQSRSARVAMTDGRTTSIRVVVAATRPNAMLIGKTVRERDPRNGVDQVLEGPDVLPQDAELSFSLRALDETRFSADEKVEIATADLSLSGVVALRLQDADVALAKVDPSSLLGASARGPLVFRVVRDGVGGDWRPLATLVRVPLITSASCANAGSVCRIEGSDLFLVRAVAWGSAPGASRELPDGFTGSSIEVPKSASGDLILSLRDAPQARLVVVPPRGG